jgi:hypothetical protein
MNDRSFGALACSLIAFLTVTSSARGAEPPPEASAPPEPPAAAATAPATPAPASAPDHGASSPTEDAEPPAAGARDTDSNAAPGASTPPRLLVATPPTQSPLVTTPPAQRPPQADLNHVDDGKMGTHQEHWFFGLGARETFVTGAAYDPFSSNNVLPQVSLAAGRAFYASGPLSFAALLGWDWGSTSAEARGADATLVVNRITLGAEGRYHVWRRFYAFGRVAPGALHSTATLKDGVVNVDRSANAWAFATDFSLGAAVEFAGEDRGASTRPRGWLGIDGGYAWAQATKLELKAPSSGDPSAPARVEPLSLGELALRGGFLRLTATITY